MAFMVIAMVAMALCGFCAALLRWNELKYMKKGLPPGTMGWPVFGETTDFLKQGPAFMKNQRARFGSFFKSHILGCPTIVSMDPDINRYILLNESKGLVPGYPQSMLDILGRSNIAAVHGSAHKHMRGALVSLISQSNIKEQILPKIDEFMRSHLHDWSDIIDIQQKTKEMAFFSALKQIASLETNSKIAQQFMPEFANLVLGTLSLPVNIPGTNYHRGFQARKNIVDILKPLLQERRSASSSSDLLGSLMAETSVEEEDDNNKNKRHLHKLSEEEIIDLIITLLYSGYETVSTTSMMAVKYLHDHPEALRQIREEHVAIRAKKKTDDAINWEDFKSMRFTRAVIFETSRLATIVNGVLRKTTQDMEINGYMIPKGWRIYVYTREINYDPYLYPDPYTFNPWRWLQDKRLENHSYFLLFGGGTRQCPGKELGVAEISTFLHYFVTRYEWEETGEDNKLVQFPRVEAPNGLHIRVKSRSSFVN